MVNGDAWAQAYLEALGEFASELSLIVGGSYHVTQFHDGLQLQMSIDKRDIPIISLTLWTSYGSVYALIPGQGHYLLISYLGFRKLMLENLDEIIGFIESCKDHWKKQGWVQ